MSPVVVEERQKTTTAVKVRSEDVYTDRPPPPTPPVAEPPPSDGEPTGWIVIVIIWLLFLGGGIAAYFLPEQFGWFIYIVGTLSLILLLIGFFGLLSEVADRDEIGCLFLLGLVGGGLLCYYVLSRDLLGIIIYLLGVATIILVSSLPLVALLIIGGLLFLRLARKTFEKFLESRHLNWQIHSFLFGVGSTMEFYPSPARFDVYRLTQDVQLDEWHRAVRDQLAAMSENDLRPEGHS
jgi:hypothetical protein